MTRTAIHHTLSAVAAVALLFAFAASTPSAGQTTTTGSIEGVVTDPTGAAAPTQRPKGLAGTASPTRKKSSAGILWSHLHNND